MSYSILSYNNPPKEQLLIVDNGLGDSNDLAAPLHEVKPLGCFAYGDNGEVIGGAVGRRWGHCCELQQLWVQPELRRQGIATKLISEFETHAVTFECSHFYLETYSFQALSLYQSLGYVIDHALDVYPHGIVKYTLKKFIASPSHGN